MRFSQRIGITQVKALQIEGIDDDLRNGLWNIYQLYLIELIKDQEYSQSYDFQILFKAIWHNFYKRRIDLTPKHIGFSQDVISDVYFRCEWYEVYDFIEFIASLNDIFSYFSVDTFVSECNRVLERENSGYRFINNKISPITNQLEIIEIEEAINNSMHFTALQGANVHLKSALEKLSDRRNPDYRNSIKESISAVESVAKKIANSSSATLGGALDQIKTKIKIHTAMYTGFKNLYGYTNDSSGIRHALMDQSTSDFEDAKFMLVSCSAFINYLIVKADKAGFLSS